MSSLLTYIINWLEHHQLPCIFKKLTQVDCPGCGFQRSFVLLLKGDIAGSFFLYPGLMPILLLFAFLFFHLLFKFKNGANLLKYLYMVCTGIIVVSYIYKILITKIH